MWMTKFQGNSECMNQSEERLGLLILSWIYHVTEFVYLSFVVFFDNCESLILKCSIMQLMCLLEPLYNATALYNVSTSQMFLFYCH